MESLHAPWRIEYILAQKPVATDSLFTKIAQSGDDEGNYVTARRTGLVCKSPASLRVEACRQVKIADKRIGSQSGFSRR